MRAAGWLQLRKMHRMYLNHFSRSVTLFGATLISLRNFSVQVKQDLR